MNWFFLALIGPLLWSFVNHIDKYLISKYFKDRGIGSLLLFSSLFSLILLPIFWGIAGSSLFSVPLLDILILIFAGVLSLIAIGLYFIALESEDASAVVPFFQTVPIFGFILGFFFLEEVLSLTQIIAGLTIVIGAGILSFEYDETKKIIWRKKVLLLVVGSSFLFALYETLFKVTALDESFVIASFWQYVGLILGGIFLLCYSREYRNDFSRLVKTSGVGILSLNAVNESLTLLGNLAFSFATLLAPIAIVMTVNAFQPIFVLLIGILLTVFVPQIAAENITKKVLIQRGVAILIIAVGSYFLY